MTPLLIDTPLTRAALDLAINLPTAKPHNREKYLLAQYILTT